MPDFSAVIDLNFKNNNSLKSCSRFMVNALINSNNFLKKFYSNNFFAYGTTYLNNSEDICLICEKKDRYVIILNPEYLRTNAGSTILEKLSESYEKNGIDSISCLNGIFSGVVIDYIQRNIHLFTDRFGLSFLYYYINKDKLFVSTQMKSFSNLPELKLNINYFAVIDLLNYGIITGDDTVLDDIFSVPASTIITVNNTGQTIKRNYWLPTFNSETVDEGDVAEKFENAMMETINYAKDNFKGKWGVTLSGGLDSRSITDMFLNGNYKEIEAVTYGNSNNREYICAKLVAEKLNIKHHLLELNPSTMVNGYADAIWKTDGMAAVSDLYLSGKYQELKSIMDLRLDGYLGDALWGGTYLSASILNANSFYDCWPWIKEKTVRWNPWLEKVISSEYSYEANKFRETRIKKIWDNINGNSRPCQKCEWVLLMTRGRKYIHQHHSILFNGLIKSLKPFMDYDCMNITWGVPPEQRINHHIYNHWMLDFHSDIFKLPTANPANFLKKSSYIRQLIRKYSFGRIPVIDKRIMYPDCWASSSYFRTKVKKYLLEGRSLERDHISISGLKKLMTIADGLPVFFGTLSTLYHIETIYRLFIEKDMRAVSTNIDIL